MILIRQWHTALSQAEWR